MRGKVLNIPTPQSGLPCKSYVHIIDLDIELRRFLSVINESNYFNQYVSNNIVRYYRYKDRKTVVQNYLDFMATYTADRLNFIFPGKIFSRGLCIQLLNSLYAGVSKYERIKKRIKNNKPISDDDIIYNDIFYKRWIFNDRLFIDQIKQTYSKVNKLVESLISCYQSYIIKYILKNRRGDKNPTHLRTDVYDIIMTIINVYNYKKSKIPFHSIMRPYIANHKNKVIQTETWGIDNLIYLDGLEEQTNTASPEDSYLIKNSIWGEVERNLAFGQKQDDKLRLLELAYQALPRPFKEITSILYELVDPLDIKQETKLALTTLTH